MTWGSHGPFWFGRQRDWFSSLRLWRVVHTSSMHSKPFPQSRYFEHTLHQMRGLTSLRKAIMTPARRRDIFLRYIKQASYPPQYVPYQPSCFSRLDENSSFVVEKSPPVRYLWPPRLRPAASNKLVRHWSARLLSRLLSGLVQVFSWPSGTRLVVVDKGTRLICTARPGSRGLIVNRGSQCTREKLRPRSTSSDRSAEMWLWAGSNRRV